VLIPHPKQAEVVSLIDSLLFSFCHGLLTSAQADKSDLSHHRFNICLQNNKEILNVCFYKNIES
jgi:hypothetical protein